MTKKCNTSKKLAKRMRGGFGQASMQSFANKSSATLPFFDITKDPRNPGSLIDSRQYEMVGGRRKRRSRRRRTARRMRGGNAELFGKIIPYSELDSSIITGYSPR
jgi:hypothetical protein